MKVICISGKAGSGKDTFANFLKMEIKERNKSVLITHYADLLKYICKQFFGWNGEKDEAGRTLLQQVGTNRIRAVSPDYWADFLVNFLGMFKDEWDYVLIPDCRFPNEVELFRHYGFDTTLVRVERDAPSTLTEAQRNHPSETALDDYGFDYIVDNNHSLMMLQCAAEELLDDLEGEVV